MNIKIYHYSYRKFGRFVSPKFFGTNGYTKNSTKASPTPRIYFYLNKKDRESFFAGANFLYQAEINKNSLYNLEIDVLKLQDNPRIKDIFSHIKKLGYKGIIGNNGFEVAALFYPIKIKTQEALTLV